MKMLTAKEAKIKTDQIREEQIQKAKKSYRNDYDYGK